MRKSEREISDSGEILKTLCRCPYLTLAMHDDGAPYALPVNFGAEMVKGEPRLYFHCANEGKKLDLLRANADLGFCAANMLRVYNRGKGPCGYTTDYESVCGKGTARILTDEAERQHALRVLLAHYADQEECAGTFDERALALTTVVEIRVREWTGKRLIRPM